MKLNTKFLILIVLVSCFVSCKKQVKDTEEAESVAKTEVSKEIAYPAITETNLIVEGDKGKWDEGTVHTFSPVEANKDGYKYWGYYGLDYYNESTSLRKGGLVRSNDLVNWEKYEGNPIIDDNCRWPTVVFKNNMFYMFYSEYRNNKDSQIVMVTSKDGIKFSDKTVVVPYAEGEQNQNPFIYFDENDSNFYLFYYNGTERAEKNPSWNIAVKKSKDVLKLKDQQPTQILSAKETLAAPSVAYYNGKYYMLVEEFDVKEDKWVTNAFVSDYVIKGYERVPNNPILQDNDACAFQYTFDNKLYAFYSHCLDLQKGIWNLKMIKLK